MMQTKPNRFRPTPPPPLFPEPRQAEKKIVAVSFTAKRNLNASLQHDKFRDTWQLRLTWTSMHKHSGKEVY
jgi:hypothetical protein